MNDDDRAVASVSVFYSGIRSTVYRCLIPSTVHFHFCLDVSETTPLRYTWGTRIPHYAPCDRLTKQKQPRAPRRDHCRRRVAIRRECASLDVSRVDSRRTRDASERFLRRRDARESTATLARRRDRGVTGRGCVNTHEGHARGRGRERTRERTSWRERATRRRASDCCARWTRGWRRRRARIGVGGEGAFVAAACCCAAARAATSANGGWAHRNGAALREIDDDVMHLSYDPRAMSIGYDEVNAASAGAKEEAGTRRSDEGRASARDDDGVSAWSWNESDGGCSQSGGKVDYTSFDGTRRMDSSFMGTEATGNLSTPRKI